jgi:hypothetical protein
MKGLRTCFARSWLFAVMAVGGCSVFTENVRVNHINSSLRQDAATAAQKDMADFSDSSKGLTPVLLNNLRDRMALVATVNDAQIHLDEQSAVTGAIMDRWRELRSQFFATFGITDRDTPIHDFDAGISIRIATVGKIADVLAALKAGENVLADRRQKAIDELSKKLDVKNPPQPTTQSAKEADYLARTAKAAIDLKTAVRNAAQSLRESERYRVQTTGVLDALFQSVQDSRDPDAAWALVPLLQTGLDPDTLALLNRYLSFLEDELDHLALIKPSSANGAATKSDDLEASAADTTSEPAINFSFHLAQIQKYLPDHVKGWKAMGLSATVRYRQKSKVKYWQSMPILKTSAKENDAILKEGLAVFSGDAAVTDDQSKKRLDRAISTLDAAYGHNQQSRKALRQTSNSLKLLATDTRRTLAISQSPIDAAKPSKSSSSGSAVTVNAANAPPPIHPIDRLVLDAVAATAPTAKSPQLAAIYARFKSAIKLVQAGDYSDTAELVAALKAINLNTGDLSNLLKDNRALTDDTQALGLSFLNAAILKIDPSANSDLGAMLDVLGPEGNKGLSDLGSRFFKVLAAPEEEKKELIAFLTRLYGVEVEILKENSRHHEVLNTIALLELSRWRSIASISTNVLYYYSDRNGNVAAGADLFEAAKSSMPKRDGAFVGRHLKVTPIEPDHRVLPSIRAMSIEARKLGSTADKVDDHEDYYAAIHRIAMANRLLGGYLLIESLNERYCADDSLRLETELREHDLLLAGIESELREIQFGHTLNELLAYHSGGFSASDISAIAQDAALIFISAQTARIK